MKCLVSLVNPGRTLLFPFSNSCFISSAHCLLREPGSGILEVITNVLKHKGIRLSDLRVERQLGSTAAIKSYLQHSDYGAFLSIHAILKELDRGTLRIIGIKRMAIHRHFYFITLQGPEGGLPALLIRFLSRSRFSNLKKAAPFS